jgi:uncharacterized protein YjbI with pentapeptide repeats
VLAGADLGPLEDVGSDRVDLPANLEGAKFFGADLRRASLRQARVDEADFGGALLDEVDFAEVDLSRARTGRAGK